MITARKHEHFFSPLVDKHKGDVVGRFDAVEDVAGRCFVYAAESQTWIPMISYAEALDIAERMANRWRPKK